MVHVIRKGRIKNTVKHTSKLKAIGKHQEIKKPKQEQLLPIKHADIIDGFTELQDHINYLPFNSFCGICDGKIAVSPRDQKHVLEVKKVPVKMMRRGALLCENCIKRRGRINYLKKGNKFIEEENGKTDLSKLESQEKELKWKSKGLFGSIDWPY